MPITQLTRHGRIPWTRPGPLRVRLDTAPGAEITLQDDTGAPVAPDGRAPQEIFIVPKPYDIVIGVRNPAGPFAPAARVGLTISHPADGPGDAVVRVPEDVSGRHHVSLVRIETRGASLMLADALGGGANPEVSEARDLTPREWHNVGRFGYHAHHDGVGGARGAWALVLDGSASMLVANERSEVGPLVELVFGIVSTARGGGPSLVAVTQLRDARDVTSQVDSGEVDWRAVLGTQPSPWARVLPAIQQAASAVGPGGEVVLVADGVPSDAPALIEWATSEECPVTLRVVGRGRSPREAVAALRPTQWWDDEFAALDPLVSDGRHMLVTIGDAVAAAAAADQCADALYPTVGTRVSP
jgi:hypothetical protein